jgi:uncharacterized protein (UPF0147 family)
MHGDIQSAGTLLAELREAYQSLPKHARTHVISVLSALAQEQQK